MGILKRGRQQRGLALVEMAIVFPLLLLLLMGMIEYGWLFLKAQQVTNAARQGARTAILPYSTNSTVAGAVATLMNAGGMAGSGYTVTITPGDVTAISPHQSVRIEVTVPYENITLVNAPFVPVPAMLRGSVTMVKEGA